MVTFGIPCWMGVGMKPRSDDPITQQHLKEMLNYDPETGLFTWRKKPGRSTVVGAVAGSTWHERGYRLISFEGRRYLAHRLAWLYVYGYLPQNELDHINRDTDDNRIANLRECTRRENAQNIVRDVGATSKYPGVSWDKARQKWGAKIRAGGKRLMLGRFDSELDAAFAYVRAKQELHPFWSPSVYPAGWKVR